MIIPPVSPVRHSGGILPYAVAAGALVAVVYSLLTAVTESAPVAAYPPRTKVAAAHVIAPHSQAARIEKQLVDVHVEAPQPVVVTRIRVPLPRAHAKPPPAVSSVAAAAPPSSAPETPTRAADTKIPDLHVTDRVRKQPDTTDPWSGGGPPDKSAIDGW
jgi:hypothetical protein